MTIDIEAIEREWWREGLSASVAARVPALIARVRELEAANARLHDGYDQLRADYLDAMSLCCATEEFCSGAISKDELMAAVDQWGESDDE